ncbi:MAG: hypothetical protein GTO02_08180 [Candidatus Dadabacteria bacterium]|nr:hypothetical protein [Candidatus Dadabacteria bacterium]NIQ14367.1 hypothetical protein [Candidatus Dadabacteria bacterium]
MDQDNINEQIKRYVSNLDRDVYTVSNIPEEVVAVIFAYVSRSPKSFRENIGTVIQEEELGQERASKFHEKWVLNYGHASVAEHAAVHIGIEKVSRLFSSILELSNEFLSFTEYSQRYQKPQKGDNYIPFELDSNKKLKNEFVSLCDFQYELYTKLNGELFEFLKTKYPVPDGMDEKSHFRALEKIAFEDARYALNLSTLTNLGMTANARAIEDTLSILLSSKYSEVCKRAEEIKNEVRFSVPTLVKYADKNSYLVNTEENLSKYISTNFNIDGDYSGEGSETNLLDFTGKGDEFPEQTALFELAKGLMFEYSDISYHDIENQLINNKGLKEFFNLAIKDLGKYDNPKNILKLIKYKAEFVLSEANWHQLLRHRKVNWTVKEPSIINGYTVPPHIKESGTIGLLIDAIEKSEILYNKLIESGYENISPYVVTNAHNRRVMADFDLWELYHLINLRMSEGAQWDIKNSITDLANKISEFHPNLVKPALERVN